MPAPKGNQFWKLIDEPGRKKLFKSPQDFLDKAYKYFEWADANPWYKNEAIKGGELAGTIIKIPIQRPYSLKALCLFIGITENTFRNYEKNDNYKVFFSVFSHIRDIIENNQMEGATVGTYNANIIARILGLVDKHEEVKDTLKIQIENKSNADNVKDLIEQVQKK